LEPGAAVASEPPLPKKLRKEKAMVTLLVYPKNHIYHALKVKTAFYLLSSLNIKLNSIKD
jgi:hypothetical protein